MNKLLKYLIDFIMCYIFALSYATPFFNVAFLRATMKDSKSWNERMKKEKHFERLMKSVRQQTPREAPKKLSGKVW